MFLIKWDAGLFFSTLLDGFMDFIGLKNLGFAEPITVRLIPEHDIVPAAAPSLAPHVEQSSARPVVPTCPGIHDCAVFDYDFI